MTGSTLRMLLALCAGLALDAAAKAALAQPSPPSQQRAGCDGAMHPDRLEGLTSEGDLILGSDRKARLAGLRLPDGSPHRDQALAWLKTQIGHPILVQGADSRDRWDRISIRIRSSQGGPALDWAHGLVDAGQDDVFCQPELLALETTARERRLGVWADDRYKPLDVNQPERLLERV